MKKWVIEDKRTFYVSAPADYGREDVIEAFNMGDANLGEPLEVDGYLTAREYGRKAEERGDDE